LLQGHQNLIEKIELPEIISWLALDKSKDRAAIKSFVVEKGIHGQSKWMRDNKVNNIYEDTQQIQMIVIARRILDYGRDMLT
jgi:hypothetical protein